MDSPGGEEGYAHSGWVGDYFTDELGEYKLAEQLWRLMCCCSVASRTSRSTSTWPHRDGPMAEKINTMEKVVVSSHLGRVGLGEHLGDPR